MIRQAPDTTNEHVLCYIEVACERQECEVEKQNLAKVRKQNPRTYREQKRDWWHR